MGEIFENYSVVYYSELYRRHDDFFSRLNIFSAEVLKKILIENKQNFFCFDEFCALSRGFKLDYEIVKTFVSENKSLSFDELQTIFRYVPKEKILSIVSNTKKYLPTVTGKYFPILKIKFDAEEISIAEQKIDLSIADKNFAAREDYDLSSNFALNPEIDEKILRDLIFQKFFSDKFNQNRTRLVKKSASIKKNSNNFTDKLRAFFISRENISTESIFNFSENYIPHREVVTVAFPVIDRMTTRISADLRD